MKINKPLTKIVFLSISLIIQLQSLLVAEVNQVEMSSGEYTIKSDEILPFDPRNNHLVFSGNTIIYGQNIRIEGDKIEGYKTKSGQFSYVKITGNPAKLYQYGEKRNGEQQNKYLLKQEIKNQSNINPAISKNMLKSLKLFSKTIEFSLLTEELTAYENIDLKIISLNPANTNGKDDHFAVTGDFLQLSPAPKNLVKISGKPLILKIIQNETALDAKAENMQYNIQTQQLELESNVYFASALGKMEAPKILYNVKTGKLSAPKIDNQTIKMIKTKPEPASDKIQIDKTPADKRKLEKKPNE